MTAADGEGLGLYVHVPFCEAKCAYCHFAIDPGRPDAPRADRYLRALLAEIDVAAEGADTRADTVYFGGGTPSLFGAERIARALDALRAAFRLDPAAEVTVEVNPRDLEIDGYRALCSAGVNRISLGLQSLDDGVLREMGRRHDAADALEAVARARRAGVSNLNLDLVLGWPGETPERWRRTLDVVLALGPEHVSFYVLEIERPSVLAQKAREGRLALPDDDLVADLYEDGNRRLDAAGLRRYEISSFARPGFESRHNGKYWDDAPFLGFGLSAHSARGGRRFWNLDRYGSYCRAIEQGGGGAAVAGERWLSPREQASEALFTGLRRREGVVLAAFRERYGSDPLVDHARALDEAQRAGLVVVADGRLRLTDRGVLVSNEVFQAFV